MNLLVALLTPLTAGILLAELGLSLARRWGRHPQSSHSRADRSGHSSV